MDAKISPSFWNDDKLAAPSLRLAALWLRTNAYISPIGFGEYSLRRFVFETGLPSEALAECFQALGRGCRHDERAYWLRDFIAENFARGDSLADNNFTKGFSKHIAVANCPWLPEVMREEYPELFRKDDGEGKPSKGVLVVVEPQEKRGEEKSGAEKLGSGVQGGREESPVATAEDIYEAYPKHVGRKAALKAIAAALRDRHGPDLLASTVSFARAVRGWPAERRRFVPNPATWFNRGHFDDDHAYWAAESAKNSGGGAAIEPFDPTKPHAHTGGAVEAH